MPFSTSSARAPICEPITGVAHANASTITIGNPSYQIEGTTIMAARLISSSTASRGRVPSKVTFGPAPWPIRQRAMFCERTRPSNRLEKNGTGAVVELFNVWTNALSIFSNIGLRESCCLEQPGQREPSEPPMMDIFHVRAPSDLVHLFQEGTGVFGIVRAHDLIQIGYDNPAHPAGHKNTIDFAHEPLDFIGEQVLKYV